MQADATPYYDNGNYINYHSGRNLEVIPLPGLNTVFRLYQKSTQISNSVSLNQRTVNFLNPGQTPLILAISLFTS